ncbi:PREDICTED: SH3 domain-binding glutamic acid-rich-like protein 2 [Ficedula albicollis]|uniref:SH3 domain-binding glutamic acid-rich-like protein 2 n=1 Tax=Ficedula albicollis TaxID=59894 RepID=UPI0007AD7906|nr:PREDICTED: SH3 domain-binding glutamic acid-rich-like protein 2 [Ficedula albicollis]
MRAAGRIERLTHFCGTDPVVDTHKGPVVFLGNHQLASVVTDALSIHLKQQGGRSKRHVAFGTASDDDDDAIKKRQQDVVRFLEANRIEFEEVDITMSEEKRQWMYKNIPEDRQPAQGNPLPPQIFSDDRYCGDYDGFFESKESNTVFSFLGLKPTLASKESEP